MSDPKDWKCEECGLPLFACNALALYRKAAQAFEIGRTDIGRDLLEQAHEEYQRFYDEARPDV